MSIFTQRRPARLYNPNILGERSTSNLCKIYFVLSSLDEGDHLREAMMLEFYSKFGWHCVRGLLGMIRVFIFLHRAVDFEPSKCDYGNIKVQILSLAC